MSSDAYAQVAMWLIGGLFAVIGTLLALYIRSLMASVTQRITSECAGITRHVDEKFESIDSRFDDLDEDVARAHETASKAHARIDETRSEFAERMTQIRIELALGQTIGKRLDQMDSRLNFQGQLMQSIAERLHISVPPVIREGAHG